MSRVPALDNTNQSQIENIFKNYSIVIGREEGMLQRINSIQLKCDGQLITTITKNPSKSENYAVNQEDNTEIPPEIEEEFMRFVNRVITYTNIRRPKITFGSHSKRRDWKIKVERTN